MIVQRLVDLNDDILNFKSVFGRNCHVALLVLFLVVACSALKKVGMTVDFTTSWSAVFASSSSSKLGYQVQSLEFGQGAFWDQQEFHRNAKLHAHPGALT